MAEKLDDSEFLKKEYAELELSFQITIDDIKFGKRQQWATTYYILLTYAAIIGFHNLIKDYLCWNQNLYSLIVLIIIALGINIFGILNIMDTQKWLCIYRMRKWKIEETFAPRTQNVWNITSEKRDEYIKYKRNLWSLIFPFIFLLVTGLLCVSLFLLHDIWNSLYTLAIVLIIDSLLFIVFFFYFNCKVKEIEKNLKNKEGAKE